MPVKREHRDPHNNLAYRQTWLLFTCDNHPDASAEFGTPYYNKTMQIAMDAGWRMQLGDPRRNTPTKVFCPTCTGKKPINRVHECSLEFPVPPEKANG